ncbi:hypothetical protein [Thalassospira marina]|uniref:Uncharacterized protein n=1 Tax=Thalassospira marina TaxID=2048283 RepID=A0ABN5FNK9_9PROT|nr:hypothetical protein [Thalassospira marina]AUG55454.1 hypothetical protein CSC3H3_21570 [Thalassospira marina]
MSKVVNKERDTVFVDRFWSGAKMVMALVFLGFLGFFLLLNAGLYDDGSGFYSGSKLTAWEKISDPLGKYGYGYLWGSHSTWGRTYHEGCVAEENWGCTKDTTPFQFVLIQLKDDTGEYVRDLILFLFMFWMSCSYPLMRKPCPIVFNRHLAAIYTWYRGRLWILPASEFSYRYQEGANFLSGRWGNGPMQMKLRSSERLHKRKNFKIGTYPYPCEKYGVRLAEALEVYLRTTDQDTSYIPPATSYRWWERSILGRKKLPDDIHDQAAARMRKYGEKAS